MNNGTVNPTPATAAVVAGGLSPFATTSDIQRPVVKNVFRTTASPTSPPPTAAGPDVELHEKTMDSMTATGTATAVATSSMHDDDILGLKNKDSHGMVMGLFLDDMGGEINGLMSCTESLGFESMDERRTEDYEELEMLENRRKEFCIMKPRLKKEIINKFPPPLSTLTPTGQPNFYLRPERKNGRLELTEVQIERPEILRASRRDGRLRLQLIRDDDDVVDEDEEEDEGAREEKGGVGGGEWKFPERSGGGGGGLWRCYELVNHHGGGGGYHRHLQHHRHHSSLHVWSHQHCVTIG